MNFCIPACVLLALHSRLGSPIRTLNIHKLEVELQSLNFRSLLKLGTIGLSLNQISELEALNSDPIPPALIKLFPALAFFKGIAINQFIMRRKGNDFRLFPTSLSKHSRSTDRFQIDILVDNIDIRPENKTLSPVKHCLTFTNLARFVSKLSGKFCNASKYEVVCRSCFKLFHTIHGNQGRLKHDLSCSHQTRGVLGRRKSKNRLLHRPYIVNSYTQKIEKNGLWFKRGFNFKRLKPAFLCFLDFEQYHQKLTGDNIDNAFAKQPPSAVAIQTPMSYSYCFSSLYSHISLPSSLSNVRIKFLDQSNGTTLKDFYIGLLLSIRKDMLLLANFLQEVLAKNRPPPRHQQRSLEQRIYMLTISHCQICGLRFNSKRRIGSNTHYIRRCFDHDHFLT